MKVLSLNRLRLYLLYPTYGVYGEEGFLSYRRGKKLQLDTGFTYLEQNEELGSWLSITILGFGLGFYWNFGEEEIF